MKYLAITQATAEWLMGKAGLLDAVHSEIVSSEANQLVLENHELAEGPFRASAKKDPNLIAIWNSDYLAGTGDELWGFVKIDAPLGLQTEPAISREVFERTLIIINQRLQGLMIDGSFLHRPYDNGAHTCIAARGTAARQFNIGFYEKIIEHDSHMVHSIICIGPEHDYGKLRDQVEIEAKKLDLLVRAANILVAPTRKKLIAERKDFEIIRAHLAQYTRIDNQSEFEHVEVSTASPDIQQHDRIRTQGLTYDDWVKDNSSLTETQKKILFSDVLNRHPIRILGPGGSGKTLLMQLLALRLIKNSKGKGEKVRVIYIVHNSAMVQSVKQKFLFLSHDVEDLKSQGYILDVTTFAEYGRRELGLEHESVIDPDAYEAKQFQLQAIKRAIGVVFEKRSNDISKSELLSAIKSEEALNPIFARLCMAEISIAIKGHGLESDKRRYVHSERGLSRLHSILNQAERDIVFEVFQNYHREVFEGYGVLDSDDIAISLLGRLHTPIWELKRKTLGYDYVFVDEAQLFNENEKRVLPLLTNSRYSHVPVALALDQAQDIFGQSSAGLAALGIKDIANENLSSIHRSTPAIVRLAFFVIQKTTDLFGQDFPNFTEIAESLESDSHPLAFPPRIEVAPVESRSLGKFVVKRIRELRKSNIRKIAVICHAEQYWDALLSELRQTDLPLTVVQKRGEKTPANEPAVVLVRPQYAGGQEFEAVVAVGLEQGVVPPKVAENETLTAAVEQQSLREIYLTATRARYKLIFVMSHGSTPTNVLHEAEEAGLIVRA
jgi:superfamily I DNA/RNA helicase